MSKTTKKKASKKKPALVHEFDLTLLQDFLEKIDALEATKLSKQLFNAFTFYRQLNKQKPLRFVNFKLDFNAPLYRVAAFKATSVMGSISHGGRFNLGGSQFQPLIQIDPFAALYLSNNLQCAIEEYAQGTPLKANDLKYVLTPSKTLKLWDIDNVVNFLNFPNLKNLINQGPLFSSWGYCKVPMQSQILAFWLKNIGGDGVIFKSTQNIKASCVALFVRDDAHAESLFSQTKIL